MNFSIEKIIKLLRKNFLIMLAVALLCSAAMYYYKKNNTIPVYTAYTELYVNTVFKEDGTLSSGISAERNYVSTYIEMFKTVKYSNEVHGFLSEEDQQKITPNGIHNALAIGSKNETEIIYVRVYNTDRDLAHDIAKAVAQSAPKYLNKEFGVAAVKVVEDARITGVSSVSYKKSVIIGFVFGAVLVFFIAFIKDLYDYRLRNSSEIKERYNLPVLGTVPMFDSKASGAQDKYKYYNRYRRGRRK